MRTVSLKVRLLAEVKPLGQACNGRYSLTDGLTGTDVNARDQYDIITLYVASYMIGGYHLGS